MMLKFYDNQTGDYSHHIDIVGLYSMLLEDFCECHEGYDVLDPKDGTMKCLNCCKLDNLESISEQEMINYIESHDYTIEICNEEC